MHNTHSHIVGGLALQDGTSCAPPRRGLALADLDIPAPLAEHAPLPPGPVASFLLLVRGPRRTHAVVGVCADAPVAALRALPRQGRHLAARGVAFLRGRPLDAGRALASYGVRAGSTVTSLCVGAAAMQREQAARSAAACGGGATRARRAARSGRSSGHSSRRSRRSCGRSCRTNSATTAGNTLQQWLAERDVDVSRWADGDAEQRALKGVSGFLRELHAGECVLRFEQGRALRELPWRRCAS